MKLSDSQLKMLLLGSNLIAYDKLSLAEQEAKRRKVSLLDVLPGMGLLSSEQLGRIVADALKYNFVSLKREKIDKKILNLLPEVFARTNGVVVYAKTDHGFRVAMLDPEDIDIIHVIEKRVGDKVLPFFMMNDDLGYALSKYDTSSAEEEFAKIVKSFKDSNLSSEEKDGMIIRAFDVLMQYAYQNKTSDLHIEPFEEKVVVRFRMDGVLHDVLEMSKELYDLILSRLKILSKMRTDEHRKAQDGKFKFDVGIEVVDVRVSVLPITNGEKTVMRILSSQRTQFGLDDLGLSEYNIKKVMNSIRSPHGMILITGPTGSGKTTTVYGVMKILNRREVNIASIEDPVEYAIEGVNQIQVDGKADLTFANGLRAILRQDPDIVMIGEIRDEETAGIAVNSALTGHLVLSTLHTNNAATTLPRLLDMNIESFLVASTVNIVIAQRLVRKICEKCRSSYKATEEEKKIINNDSSIMNIIKGEGFENLDDIRFYKGSGCEACGNTGFSGRMAITEVLEMSENIKNMIIQHASSDEIQNQAKKEGMNTMLHDGVIKVFKGITTLMEVYRVTRE